ncbi:protein aveugle isoform X1 [Panulirus ornatus]|uniref:protein aveugle isoform X1 n=1 Tax=Panulirus ornatus TaxID=150431 RepID=UPI003A86CC5A
MMKLLASKQTMDNKTETVGDASQPIKPKGKLARPKPCYLWTTADVQKWFKRHCSEYFQLYSHLLIMHDIMGKALVRMTEGTLIRLGIRHPEHVEAIWREILKLRLKADIQEMKEIEMSSIIS